MGSSRMLYLCKRLNIYEERLLETINPDHHRHFNCHQFNLICTIMRKINLIVIHCSATRSNQRFTYEMLKKCHEARFPGGIGYHYYITRDGQLWPSRPEEVVGGHARHYNAHSIGICYEGGLDEHGRSADTRTPAQKAAMFALLRSLKVDYPDAMILGHCELPGVHKDCPSFIPSKEYQCL